MYKRHVKARYRLYRKRVVEFVVHKILGADDPPYKLAMGVAVGIFVTFTPTVPFQMMLVVAIAWMLRANKVVGVPLVWITNPVTFIPIYGPCYMLGAAIMGYDSTGMKKTFDTLWEEQETFWATAKHIGNVLWEAGLELAGPLWLGCLIVAVALAVPSYFVTYWAVVKHRQNKIKRAIHASVAPSSPPPA